MLENPGEGCLQCEVDFFFLSSTYKWNHAVFVFPCLVISLSVLSSQFVPVVVNGRISLKFAKMINLKCSHQNTYIQFCFASYNSIKLKKKFPCFK